MITRGLSHALLQVIVGPHVFSGRFYVTHDSTSSRRKGSGSVEPIGASSTDPLSIIASGRPGSVSRVYNPCVTPRQSAERIAELLKTITPQLASMRSTNMSEMLGHVDGTRLRQARTIVAPQYATFTRQRPSHID